MDGLRQGHHLRPLWTPDVYEEVNLENRQFDQTGATMVRFCGASLPYESSLVAHAVLEPSCALMFRQTRIQNGRMRTLFLSLENLQSLDWLLHSTERHRPYCLT